MADRSTSIILARHGRTAWHDGNRYTGSSDIGIDDEGRRQAQALASWARANPPDALYASTMLRSRETAQPVADMLGLPVIIDHRLRELDFGRAEGRTLAELRVEFPREVALFEQDAADHPLPGGEDPNAAARRATEAVDEIAARHAGQTVLVICHNTLMRLIVCTYAGIPLGSYRTVLNGVAPTAMARLVATGGVMRLDSYNVPPTVDRR